jgi:hypothetical protein
MTLPGLEGVPHEQLFDHFMGAQFTMTDANGNQITYSIIPGTVASVQGGDLVITPNGRTTTQTFRITADTVVHGMPNQGSNDALSQDDKVVVLTVGNSADASFVVEKGMMGHKGGYMMHR